MSRNSIDDIWYSAGSFGQTGHLRGKRPERLLDIPDLASSRERRRLPAAASLGEAWEARAREAANAQRIAVLEQRLEALEEQQDNPPQCEMWIHTFAPEPYPLKKPIPILVRTHDGESLASFSDANINISGETEAEAFASIKSLILDAWDRLQKLSTNHKLGPKLQEKLAVLQEYIDGS
jgi:hypothetical protein